MIVFFSKLALIMLSVFSFVDASVTNCDCKRNEDEIIACYISKTSFCQLNTDDCEYTLDGEFMNSGLRLKLENSTNFGSNGVVDCKMSLKPITDFSSVTAIEDCGCDMIFSGSFPFDTLNNYKIDEEFTSIPTGVSKRIKEWSIKCKNNLVILTQEEAGEWGYQVKDLNKNPNTPIASTSLFSIFRGPFGNISEFRQGGLYQGVITQIPLTGAETLALDAIGQPTVVIDSATNDLILGDIGIFCSNSAGPVSDGPDISNNNDVLVCNIFALGCQIAQGVTTSYNLNEVCPGQSILLDNGQTVNIEGVYSDTLLAASGCDSIAFTELKHFDMLTNEIIHKSCSGDGFSVIVNGEEYNESNPTGQEVLQSSDGCDSIVNVNLEFNTIQTKQINDNNCENSGFFIIVNGQRYDQTNPIGQEILQSSFGCDSIVDINLSFGPPSSENIDGNYCEGSGFSVLVNNIRYDEFNPSGQEILVNQYGCDSTVFVDLEFGQISSLEINESYCQGDGSFVTVNNIRYDERNPTGQEVLINQFGCDSIINVNLEFYSNSIFDLRDTLCEQSGFRVNVGNGLYDESNPTGQEILVNSNNCDSTINISLLFHPISETEIIQTKCNGDGFELDVNGRVFNEFNPTGTVILANQYGCDSTVIVDLDFITQDSSFEIISVCEGESILIDGSFYSAGMGDFIAFNRNGLCDSVYQFEVISYPIPEFMLDSNIIVNSNSNYLFQNEIPAGYQISWFPQNGLSCANCPNPILRNDATETQYIISIIDENECVHEFEFPISYNSTPYIPSAFSPNNDGINDTFQIFFKNSAQSPTINNFQIFNRWGGLIYSEKNLDPFSSQEWWDGTNHGKKLNTGIYIYQIEIEYPNGEKIEFEGDITLIK